MKDKIKEILKIVLFEALMFSALMPYVDPLSNLKRESARWLFGYLFFFAAVMASLIYKKPAVFFPVWLACSAADFVFDKNSLLIAVFPVALWVLLNIVKPLNLNDLTEKKQKTKAVIISIAFAAALIAILIIVAVLTKINTQFTLNAKYYRVPWAVLTAYYAYFMAAKSRFPRLKKARSTVKTKIASAG